MARSYKYDRSKQALYRPAEAPDFFQDWTDEDTENEDLLCAEMARLAYADRDRVARALGTPGFTLGPTFGGSGLGQRIALRGTEAFVARHPGRALTVLAFRGTESNRPEDLLADLLTGDVTWPGRGRVHVGFARAFEPVRAEIAQALDGGTDRLFITGHSLGAAVATLAAADLATLRPTLITFGSPRAGDAEFARSLDGLTMRRFVNCCDLVTRIPPEAFTRGNIESLLDVLLGDGVISAGVATAMAGILSQAGFNPRFEHLAGSRARYIDRNGTRRDVANATTDPGVAADQHAARTAYGAPSAPGIASPLPAAIAKLAGSGLKPEAVLSALGDSIAHAVGHLSGDPVPLRDLADHAPINYVSGISGRLP